MKQFFEATGKSIEEAIDAAMLLAGDVSNYDVDVEVLDSGSKGFLGIGSKPARVRISFEDGKPEPKPVKEFKPKQIKPIEFDVKDAKPVPRKEAKIRPAEPAPKKAAPKKEKGERKADFSAVSVKKSEAPEAKPVVKVDLARLNPEIKDEASVTESEKKAAAAALEFLQGVYAKMELAPEAKVTYTTETINIFFSGKSLGALIGRRGETLNALQYLTNLVVNRQLEGEHVRIVLDVEGYREEREETLIAYAGRMAEKCVKSGRKVELDPMNPHERRIVHIALEADDRVETLSYGSEPFRKVVITPKHKKVRK